MKSLFTSLCLFLLGVSAQAQKVVNDPNAEARSIATFHAISIASDFQIVISQGTETGLAVSAQDKDDVAFIKTVVENGTLKISFDNKKKRAWTKNRRLKAYISVKELDALNVSGACEVSIDGTLKVASLKVHLSGASDLKGRLEVSGTLEAHLNGASDMRLSGTAANTEFHVSGASEIRAYEFYTGICKVDASGASSITIHVDKELSARLSGASSLSYSGEGKVRESKTGGASSISKKS
jgi:hypothetical protein